MAVNLKAILFDLGGTLLYFNANWPALVDTANRQLMAYLQQAGYKLDEETFLSEFRTRVEEYYIQRDTEFVEYTTAHILRTLLMDLGNPEPPAQVLEPALRSLYAVSQEHWICEPDAIATLDALQARGLRMGVVSNASDDADVQTLVDNAGLRGYFDFVLSSAACGIRKPNPRIFHMALKPWNLQPAQAAMVGDTLGADILGARNAGLFSIWITRRADKAANRDHLDTIQPDATIDSLAGLLPLLEA